MRRNNIIKQKGVAIIEMAIVMPLLFLFVFASIDFVRYLQTKATLDKATELTANISKRLPLLDRNPRALITPKSRDLFIQSVNKAINAGNTFASIAFASDNAGSISKYHKVNQTIKFADPESFSKENSLVGLVFPCQSAILTDPDDGSDEVFTHEVQPSTGLLAGTGTGCNLADDLDVINDDYLSALRENYILSVARVEFNFMTPFIDFFGPTYITSVSRAKREMPQVGNNFTIPEALVYDRPETVEVPSIDPIDVEEETETGGGDGGAPDDIGTGFGVGGNGGGGGGGAVGSGNGTLGGGGDSGGPVGGGGNGAFSTD